MICHKADTISEANSIEAIAIPGRGEFCGILAPPRIAFAFWIPSFAFEFFLCTLAIAKGYVHFKAYGAHFSTGVRLVDVLVGDSILYFVVLFD
uniref:Uncharacterized protein n=1 Tax=Psilocybe cubensis TaxID=181762 RepID=A0A8H7XSA3_PSICU